MKALGWLRNGSVMLLRGIVIALVLLMTLDVLWGVFSRFVLGSQAPYTDEAARVFLVWISFLGGALAFEAKAHLGVDFLVSKFEPSVRKVCAMLVQVLTVGLAVVVLVWGGWRMAITQMDAMLATIDWLPRGMVYMAAPLGGCFIVLFALETLVDIIRTPAEKLGAMTQSEG